MTPCESKRYWTFSIQRFVLIFGTALFVPSVLTINFFIPAFNEDSSIKWGGFWLYWLLKLAKVLKILKTIWLRYPFLLPYFWHVLFPSFSLSKFWFLMSLKITLSFKIGYSTRICSKRNKFVIELGIEEPYMQGNNFISYYSPVSFSLSKSSISSFCFL